MEIYKDILTLIALELDYESIVNLCLSNKKFNNYICNNNTFWRNKVYETYPISKEYKIIDFRNFYKYIEFKRTEILNNTNGEKLDGGFNRLSFLKTEFLNFIKNTDFGNVKNTNFPLNFILTPLLKKGILNRVIVLSLFDTYFKKNNLFHNNSYRIDSHLEKYLEPYLLEMERENTEIFDPYSLEMKREEIFDRNNFNVIKFKKLIYKGIFLREKLSENYKTKLKDEKTNLLVSKISNIVLESGF